MHTLDWEQTLSAPLVTIPNYPKLKFGNHLPVLQILERYDHYFSLQFQLKINFLTIITQVQHTMTTLENWINQVLRKVTFSNPLWPNDCFQSVILINLALRQKTMFLMNFLQPKIQQWSNLQNHLCHPLLRAKATYRLKTHQVLLCILKKISSKILSRRLFSRQFKQLLLELLLNEIKKNWKLMNQDLELT